MNIAQKCSNPTVKYFANCYITKLLTRKIRIHEQGLLPYMNLSHKGINHMFHHTYSKVTYCVDSLNLKYFCNQWSDSHGVFGIRFRMQKIQLKFSALVDRFVSFPFPLKLLGDLTQNAGIMSELRHLNTPVFSTPRYFVLSIMGIP